MAALQIELFGSPALSYNGQPLPINRNKAVALCAYLALHAGPCRRDTLAALLWPELGQARARADLRRELAHLRETAPPLVLEADRETVALGQNCDLFVDVLEFRNLIIAAKRGNGGPTSGAANGALTRLTDGVALYRGDFLEGFTLRDAPEFDAWQYLTAEELRQQLAWALETLFNSHLAANNFEAARAVGQRRLALDPLDEAAHQALIELHLRSGNRRAAQRHYAQCVQLLQQELGAPPGASLQALAAQFNGDAALTVKASPAISPAALTPLLAPAPPAAEPEAEIHTVVALSLGILPVAGADDDVALEEAFGNGLADFCAVCQERLTRAGAKLIYSSSESLLALWGLPFPNEDDAEHCLDCAFDLRAAAQGRLTTAIGVAAGSVYVQPSPEAVSSITAPSATAIAGPVLNLAADLQRAAAGGELLVDRAAFQLTSGAVRYGAQEHALIHGKTVAFYRALGLPMEADKARGLTGLRAPLIGRDAELDRLHAALEYVLNGESRVVFVNGTAGLGKSRLVAELRAQTAANPALRWLTGRCRTSTAAISYWPFAEILRLWFGWRPDDGEAVRVAAIDAGVAALQRAGYLAAADIDELTAVLGVLFAVRFGDDRDERLRFVAPGQLRYRTLLALTKLLCACCRQQPTVLVLEDLHWADMLSLDLIREMLTKLTDAPMLLLCVYRPEAGEACVRLPALAQRRAPANMLEIQLHELAQEDTARLIDALLGEQRLPGEVHRWLLERAQGNPFFAEESVRALVEGGELIRDGNGVWRLANGGRGWQARRTAVTPGIDSLIMSRAARLDAGLRQTLQVASVVGVTFSTTLLAALLPETPALDADLRALEQADFLLCERLTPQPEYSFKHVLLREAFYKMLPASRRAQLHWQAAQTIERFFADDIESRVEVLAEHYLHTDDHDAAVRYLVRAGARAQRAFLNDQARTFFAQALQRCRRLDGADTDLRRLEQQIDIWQRLGRVEYAIGAFAEAEHAFRTARTLADAAGWEPHRCVRISFWTGETLIWQAKFVEMEQLCRSELALLGADDRSLEKVLMLGHLAPAVGLQGRGHEYCDNIAQYAPQLLELPFCEELTPAFSHLLDRDLILQKKEVDTRRMIAALATGAGAVQDLNCMEKAAFAESTWLACCGDLEGSRRAALRALAYLQVTGESTLQYYCNDRLADLGLITGNLAEAAHYTRQIAQQAEAQEAFNPFWAAEAAYLAIGVGDSGEAVRLLHRALACDTIPRAMQSEFYFRLGCALLAHGDRQGAVAACKMVLRPGPAQSLPYLKLPPYRHPLETALVVLDAALDDEQAFHSLCQEVQRDPPEWISPTFRWHLEAATPFPFAQCVLDERFAAEPASPWQWIDPTSTSLRMVKEGLHIHAGEGRALVHLNVTAPRLVTALDGDFAIQTTTRRADLPGLPIGGLCLWFDANYFLTLTRGEFGTHEVALLEDPTILHSRLLGRGRLTSDSIILRFERQGEQVRGLCSEDGERWWLVGATNCPVTGTVLVGPLAIGLVRRTFHPGAPAQGGALAFADVQIWQ